MGIKTQATKAPLSINRQRSFERIDSVRLMWAEPISLMKLALFLMVVGLFAAPAQGQRSTLPSQRYYQGFREFYQADYRDAGKDFTQGANGAYKFGTQRYLDSICYWTMMGECHYHMGNYAEAIQLYEQSLDLYLSFQSQQWQARVQIPPAISADTNATNQARITWAKSNRNARVANVPNTFSVMFGRLDAARAIDEGGIVDNPEMKQVNLTEIMRCAALALHRRRVIKGPTSKYDPFTVRLVNGLGANIRTSSALGAYNLVLLGIAQSSLEQWDKAANTLKRSLQFNGMDHPLTPVALLEMANVGLVTENYEVAGTLALEASISAATFNQFDLIEESLSLGSTIHLMRSKTPYPPLEPAIVWANREKVRLMQASLTVRMAECLAESGQPDLAANVLRQTGSSINNRTTLGNAVVSARLKYVAALVQFLKADFAGGLKNLSDALVRFQKGSLWLYRLGLADTLVVNGAINSRQADLLYGTLLHDPTELDWKIDPFEATAFLASNHVAPMERWFDIVVDRKDMDRAVGIAELVRRHRFFASVPMGGRLMAFRWVMHAPEESLSAAARKQRQAFYAQNSRYKLLSDQADQLRDQLLLLPAKIEEGSDEARKQVKLCKELGEASDIQEAMLASFALRREPAELVFPPQFEISEFRESIAEDQLALVTLATSSGYHLFFVNSSSVNYLGLGNPRDVQRGVGGLLKKLGLMEAAMDIDDLKSEEWKEESATLTGKIFGNVPADAWNDVRELVIVPDGLLWYLPFELLQVGEDADQKNLCDAVDIRYSPTLFLAYGTQRVQRKIERTAVVVAKMHSRVEPEMSTKAFEKLAAELPNAVKYERQVRIPSNLLGSVIDQLIVWSDVRQARGDSPFAMMPMQIDQGKTGTTLGSWMSLPWEGPEHFVMPGFNSDGGTSLRAKLNGSDLFLTTMGLMASGTRSILISRWRMGGANSLALTRNYATRRPKMGGSKALRESIELARGLALNYENEPRLRTKKNDEALKAEHPAFWAANMFLEIQDGSKPEPREILAEPAEDADKKPDAGDANPDNEAKLDKDAEPMKEIEADKEGEAKAAEEGGGKEGAEAEKEGSEKKRADEKEGGGKTEAEQKGGIEIPENPLR